MFIKFIKTIYNKVKQFWHWSNNFEDDYSFALRMEREYESTRLHRKQPGIIK
jgi:hypothetical protein